MHIRLKQILIETACKAPWQLPLGLWQCHEGPATAPTPAGLGPLGWTLVTRWYGRMF